jgi:D-alanine-D-alanine ligase
MSSSEPAGSLDVAVLLGDPREPYAYGVDGRFGEEDFEAVRQLQGALERVEGFRFTYLDDHGSLIDTLRDEPPDLALNLCDTGYRNVQRQELNVPALLEILGIAYTGSGPVCMSLCTDKALVRSLAVGHGIPVPNETFVDLQADPLVLPELYPALIKPNSADGSMGITEDCVVHDAVQAEAYLRRLAGELDRPQALIQDFLTGPEYTVGLVGNPDSGFTVLPPLVIDYSRLDPGLPPILSYGSKADPDSPYWKELRFRPAELDDLTFSRLVDHSAVLFKRLGCRDYARFDFRAGSDGEPRLLDANYNPTWSWDGKMALMAGYAGQDYAWLLRMILEAAALRCGLRA